MRPRDYTVQFDDTLHPRDAVEILYLSTLQAYGSREGRRNDLSDKPEFYPHWRPAEYDSIALAAPPLLFSSSRL